MLSTTRATDFPPGSHRAAGRRQRGRRAVALIVGLATLAVGLTAAAGPARIDMPDTPKIKRSKYHDPTVENADALGALDLPTLSDEPSRHVGGVEDKATRKLIEDLLENGGSINLNGALLTRLNRQAPDVPEIVIIRHEPRARDVLRRFVNVRNEGRRPDRDDQTPITDGPGASLLEETVDTLVTEETAAAATRILQPEVEPSGYTSITVAGLGRFMLILSQDGLSVEMVDFESGHTIRFADSSSRAAPNQLLSRDGQGEGEGESAGYSGQASSVFQFLRKIKLYILYVVEEPLTGVLAFLLLLLWGAWRVGSRA